jgi:type VI secretion system protein ImpF
VPLFDRLEGGTESLRATGTYRVLDARALRDSVQRDLSRLLNTRRSLRGSLRQLAEGTVLDYGLPDFSALTPASDADRGMLAKLVAGQIAAHEPRLRNVRVVFEPDANNPKAVQGVILASLAMGVVYEPVTFNMALDLASASPVVSLA